MKKITALLFSIILVISISVMGLVGCTLPFDGDLDKEDKSKINISFGYLLEEKDLAIKIKKSYEATHPNINLKMVGISGDWKSAMNKFVGKPSDFPDIMWVPGDQHSPYSSGGAFVDLRERMEADPETKIENYYDSMIEATHFSNDDQGIWYAPRDYNKIVTFINKDMFKAVGLEIPKPEEWNYEKFLEVSAVLRREMDANGANGSTPDYDKFDAGITPDSFPADLALDWSASYHGAVRHFGGTLIDTTLSGAEAIKVDSPATVDAYRQMFTEVVNPRYTVTPKDGYDSPFLSKVSAMWLNVRPKLPIIISRNINVEFLPSPFTKVGAGNSGYAITLEAKNRKSTLNGNTKNNEEHAWDVIKWLITEPGQQVLGSSGSGVPVLKSLAENGSWISNNDPTLNHDVFTKPYGREDVDLNIFNIYKPTSHKTMSDGMSDIVTRTLKDTDWVMSGGRFEMTDSLKAEIAKTKKNMVEKAV